jgi:Outer membrane protein beta-barrel domain
VKQSMLLACAIACLSTPAYAQTKLTESGPGTGKYIEGVAGTTFGTESNRTFSGEIGVDATRNLAVYGNLGRMQNIAPKASLDGSGLTAKHPANFGIAGVKYRVPTNSTVRPYVVGGAGVGRAAFDQSDVKTSKLVYETGAGLEIPVGPMYVDTGYRYGKFVGVEDTNVSRAYAGVGYRFGRTR